MSFLARLFINDRVINVQSSRIHFYQNKDIAGKPTGRIHGGVFTLVLELDAKTDLLHQMMAIGRTVEGYVRFYKRDAMSRLTDYEFKGTYIYKYRVTQTANGSNPALVEISFSPGLLRIGDVIHRKPWCDEEFDLEQVEVTPDPGMVPDPKLIKYYFTDGNNEEIKQKKIQVGDKITLVIVTENASGKQITIELNDKDLDYEYKGSPLLNDTLSEIMLTGNKTRIDLKAIKQRKN